MAEFKVETMDCSYCGSKLDHYTSKKGKKYWANPDHSPHWFNPNKEEKPICCVSWDEFNAVKGIPIEVKPEDGKIQQPIDVKESQLKRTELLDDKPKARELDVDAMVIKKQLEKDNSLLELLWARYVNVKEFILKKNESNPAVFGMFFNNLLKDDKND